MNDVFVDLRDGLLRDGFLDICYTILFFDVFERRFVMFCVRIF